MEKFNLKVMGTKDYIDESKREIKKLHESGKSSIEIVEELFKNYPTDVKELLIKDIELYF